MWYWSFSPLIFILLLSKTQHSFASQKPRRFYHRSAKSVELQRGNYTAHISLLLILKAWSILQNTEFLPCILWGLSASVLILLQLCPVACICASLSIREDGKPHPELGLGLMVCPSELLSYPRHPRSTELGCSTGDSRSTFSFLLCCTPGNGRWRRVQELKQELWAALW